MAPRIAIIGPPPTSELAKRLEAGGLQTISASLEERAALLLLDASNGDIEAALALVPPWVREAGTPTVVLAPSQPATLLGIAVVGWLTSPATDAEIAGVLRALAALQPASDTPALENVYQRLAIAEAERENMSLADQKKDEFISYISHELKNPMASIKGYADLMRRRSAKLAEDPNRKGLEIISNQVGRMTVLLDQLLDYSRISLNRLNLDLRPLNLVSLAQRLVDETQALTDRHAIQLVVDIQPMPIDADENRLRQALLAIASNAITFSPAAGTIVVRVSQIDGRARIGVADKGIGIPSNEQPFVFDRFVRGSNAGEAHNGLGLGLFLAREIVTRHGGNIELESELGNGSTFTIALPVKTA